jgi:hypothetical protein
LITEDAWISYYRENEIIDGEMFTDKCQVDFPKKATKFNL